ncbi:Acyl-coenzyme A thioesterase 13 [Strongyloides ratti]|uniref:Acyl-coenzyme A thioesterase 13 n=1 Tax=Strongyloides ratti TaxID=34506 RepID=A0A090LJP7_STRRB|nr:Acyl-coenzyme A thioesterase 13 [Strongyloides ratti]CEF67730.1 Acyl-coenzyme A thioesterase 13 [Strongyloides ratti]
MNMAGKYFNLIQNFLQQPIHKSNFMKCITKSRLICADEGKVKIEMEVTDELTNPGGTLHGGCSATLIDCITTFACIATPQQKPGVSVDMTISYLSSAKPGDTIILEGNVLRLGKRIAFTEGSIYLKENNSLIVKGLHTKAFRN